MASGVRAQLEIPIKSKGLHRFSGAFDLPCVTCFTILFIYALPSPVFGQIFTCTDVAGRAMTSDRPIPECANRAMRELSNAGLLRREIPAPLNAEQKRQLQLLEEQRRVAAATAEAQHQQDRALMARYRSESDITTSRNYYLGLTQDMIKRDQTLIVEAEGQLRAAQSDMKFYRNKKLSASTQGRIDEAQHALDADKNSLIEHQKEATEIKAKFDVTLARYRAKSLDQASATYR